MRHILCLSLFVSLLFILHGRTKVQLCFADAVLFSVIVSEDVIKSITLGLSIRAKIRENNGVGDCFKSASFTATSDLTKENSARQFGRSSSYSRIFGSNIGDNRDGLRREKCVGEGYGACNAETFRRS